MKKANQLPECIEVECKAKTAPFKGAWIILTVKTEYKNSFNLLFGPADDQGRLAITRIQLLAEAEKVRQMSMMDYGHPEKDWTGAIEVKPMNINDAQKALRAYELFKGFYEYPRDFQQQLSSYLGRLKECLGATITLEVSVKAGVAKLSIRNIVVGNLENTALN